MIRSRHTLFILTAFCLALGTGFAHAAAHGGGGGHGGGGNGGGGKGGMGGGKQNNNNNDDSEDRGLSWQDSYDSALDFASKGAHPVMVVIARDGNDVDRKAVELMTSWPVIVEMSKKDLAFVWQTDKTNRGKELIAQFKIKTFPYVVWEDQYGNALFGQTFPDTASAIQSVAQSWKLTLDNVNKFMQDRVAHADKTLAKGKLREAYMEYALVAPFNGPYPDLARAGKAKVLDSWKKLLELAGQMPATSRDRAGVIKGLLKETTGLDCAKTMADAVAELNTAKPAAAAVAAADDKPAAAAPIEVAAKTDATPAPAAPVSAPPPAEMKALKSLASAPVNLEHESDDASFDTHLLSESSDEKLKAADKSLKEGLVAYRAACADSMDRGEARNNLLKKAHDLFDQSVQAIDAVNTAKPNPQLDRMMSQISMLMYGCLKYQSL